jgi:hypothetical protein
MEKNNTDKSIAMGARYYKELKQIYSNTTNPLRLLVVNDDSTPSKEVSSHRGDTLATDSR